MVVEFLRKQHDNALVSASKVLENRSKKLARAVNRVLIILSLAIFPIAQQSRLGRMATVGRMRWSFRDFAPGVLARTYSMRFDSLEISRMILTFQFGRTPRGLDPRLKAACREACNAINRYPLKDTLMFDQDQEPNEEDVEDTYDVLKSNEER